MKNNDTERTVAPKTLENGNVLRMLVAQFVNKPCKQYYIPVLRCLRDSFIMIPGNVEISDADMNAFLNAKEGDMVSTQEQMKFVPDILRNGDEFFLPVFSSADQMGEYGNRFSKMERHFFDAMRYANGKEKVCGIVLDAFTQPYIVRKEDFDFIGELPTMLKTENDEEQ